jgi:putative PEP-CTERM system TPR-repeat lipoprotein
MVLSGCGLFLSEKAQLERAQEAQKRGDLRAAAIDLKSLLEKHPNNRDARFTLGLVDLQAGDGVAAVRELERARTDGIPQERVAEPLARAYMTTGEFDKALAVIDDEIEKAKSTTNPALSAATTAHNDPALYLRLRGETLFAKHNLPDSRKSFEEALKIAPNDTRALIGLATVVEALEGAEAALAVADRAVSVAPNDASVHAARGTLLMQLRRLSDASLAFAKAVELTDPAHKTELAAALAGLAQAQLAQGQIVEALDSTARMQKLAPNLPLTRYMRAYALAQDGKLDEAQELLTQNLAQAGDMRSRMLLGAVNLMQGRLAQAEMHLSSVVASAPNNTEARQMLAQVRLRQSKPEEALEVLLPALGGDSAANAGMLALAGQASLAAGKTKEGVALLKRNAEAHPQNEQAQLDLAAGYLAAGQADQALAALGGSAEKTQSPSNTPESLGQSARREYLSVLALLQKGDPAGAIDSAVKAANRQPENPALQALAAAVLMRQQQYAQARPFADAVVRLRPDDAASYTNLGRLELQQRNVDAARRNFQTALQKKPGDALATTSLALIEMSAQRTDAALAVLSESRKQDPKNIEPRVLETQILLLTGKVDDAEKLARDSLQLEPTDASLLAALGRVLSTKGQHSQALEVFERAVQKQPKNTALRFQLAIAQRMAGRNDDARQSLREVLTMDEHHIPALQMDGMLAIANGDLATATQRANVLLKAAPDQAATHELVGRLRSAQQRYAESADAFHKASELHPVSQYAIGEYEARLRGKLTAPEQPLEKFLVDHPTDAPTRIMLAQAQQSRGDREAAARSYEQVLSNQPKNPIALNNLAWMHHEDGKADAVDLARRAYEAAPNSPAIADTYAWILVNSGKAKEALKLLDPIVGSTSKDGSKAAPDIRAHYAIALARAGRNAEAKALAMELTTANAVELSSEVRALIADLAKS